MVRQCANGPHRDEYTTYSPPQDWEGRPFADDGSADITGGGGGRRRPDDGGVAVGSPITATAAAEQHRRSTRHLASPRPEGVEDARVTGDAGRRGAGAAADVQRQQHCVFDSTIPEPEAWQPSRRFQPRYVAEGGSGGVVGVAGSPAQDDVLAFTGGRKRSAVATARGGTPAHPPTQLFGPPFPAPPGLRGNKRGGGGGVRQAQLASSPLCGGNTRQGEEEEEQQQQQRRRHDDSTTTPRRSAAGAGGGNSSSPLCGGYCPPPEEWQGAPCVDEVLDRKLRSVW